MIENRCKWLSPIITMSQYDNNWHKYNDSLYSIFCRDFMNDDLYFNRKKVMVRQHPKLNNYETSFYHLTGEDMKNAITPNDRIPDFRRAERIEWTRKIIENYQCNENCMDCKKILYYEKKYKKTIRIHLTFIDVKFKVILEKRNTYYLLITAYYLKYENIIKEELKLYNKFIQQKTPLD